MSPIAAHQPAARRTTTGHRLRIAPLAVLLALLAVTVGLSVPAGAATEVHLVASGDFGARASTQTVLAEIAARNPDAAIALGDLAYRDLTPESAWCEYVKATLGEGFPFELLSGNHESLDVADGAINDFSACLPNQIPGIAGTYGREYYMDLPQGQPLVRVIMASPNLTFSDGRWAYAQGDSHHAWLSQAIDGGRAKGARWIIVAAHEPCLSVGTYSCPSPRDFYDLLLAKKVDLVLHGHEHAYMRTHQLSVGSPGCPRLTVGSTQPDCIVDTDGDFRAGAGTVFATVGTGGTPLRDISTTDPEAGYFAAASGLNSDPTYGLLDLRASDSTLAARFVGTSGAGFTDAFTLTVGPPPANEPPLAKITSTVEGLKVTVDGSTSSDPDGTITSYSWDFGDGTAPVAGATPAPHTYGQAGSYPIALTVTDDDGASATTTTTVTVTPPSTALASDDFSRTVSTGWGAAPTGGTWTVSSSGSSVSGGQGRLTIPKGTTRTAYLRSVTSTATDVSLSMTPDTMATGSGLYVSVAARAITGAGEYRAKYVLRSDGRVSVALVRTNASGTETALVASTIIPGLTYTPGEPIRVRTQVTGTSPSTIRAKAWSAAGTQPSGWAASATDSTSAMQAAGAIGLAAYLSSSATASPLVLAVDDLLATAP